MAMERLTIKVSFITILSRNTLTATFAHGRVLQGMCVRCLSIHFPDRSNR